MRTEIPAFVISVVANVVAESETHATLDSLFMYAGAPGDPPPLNKVAKSQEWLRRANKHEGGEPLEVLGRLIETYMEADLDDPHWGGEYRTRKDKIERALSRAGLTYGNSGRILNGPLATPTRTLETLIRERDLFAIDDEFERAMRNVESSPREAVSAACNILESVCKIYIQDEGLRLPKKQDLRSVWDVVRRDLGFDPSVVEDRDLKEILSGLLGVASGIGALRTHASSAHGAGRSRYRLQPRHARLAVHAAHTLVAFVLESWDQKKDTR